MRSPWRGLAARMHELVAAYARLGRFSGVVLVAQGDRVLFHRGYESASVEHGVPNTTRTRFAIGSQTKALTAAAILLLADDGAVHVHDTLAAHLPGYPEGEHITLHHLLTNTSGIPDYITTPWFARVAGSAPADGEPIARFRDLPLESAPGERMRYSNSGWLLLGEVIEKVSGLSYGEFLRRRVLAPLGMTGALLPGPDQVVRDAAAGYLREDGRVVRAPHVDVRWLGAAGGVYATAADLHRWACGLHAGRLLSAGALEAMLTPYARFEMGGYGYGCVIGEDRVEMSGGLFGFVGRTVRHADGLIVVVLSNHENAPYGEIGDGLAAVARGEPCAPPGERAYVPIDHAHVEPWLGRYRLTFAGRTSELVLSRQGDRLYAEVQGLKKAEMRALSRTRLLTRMKGEVEMELDPAAPGELSIVWAGHPVTARRA